MKLMSSLQPAQSARVGPCKNLGLISKPSPLICRAANIATGFPKLNPRASCQYLWMATWY